MFMLRGPGAVVFSVLLALAVWVGASNAQQGRGSGTPAQPPGSAEPVRKFPYPAIRNNTGVLPAGPKLAPYNSPPLGDGPWAMETYEQRNIKVSIVTRGLTAPWGIAFLPDEVILITEKAGRLRVVRKGVLEPTPVAGIPAVHSA